MSRGAVIDRATLKVICLQARLTPKLDAPFGRDRDPEG